MNASAKTILSKQELKILELLSMGHTSEKMGVALDITKYTVQTHRRNMLRKTGFGNSQQLVGWRYINRLLR
jgi:two-component system nitrate/nitrite response regulator NarL